MANTIESDEAFARRLQAQELGRMGGYHQVPSGEQVPLVDVSTPVR